MPLINPTMNMGLGLSLPPWVSYPFSFQYPLPGWGLWFWLSILVIMSLKSFQPRKKLFSWVLQPIYIFNSFVKHLPYIKNTYVYSPLLRDPFGKVPLYETSNTIFFNKNSSIDFQMAIILHWSCLAFFEQKLPQNFRYEVQNKNDEIHCAAISLSVVAGMA